MRLRKMLAAGCVLLLPVPLWASSPPAQQEKGIGATFRITATRALVEFIAVDEKTGHFVNDLRRQELELRVDGKKRSLKQLFPPSASSAGRSLAASTGGVPDGEMITGEDPLWQTSRSVRTVILLDSRTMDLGNFHQAVLAIRRFVDRSLGDNHLVMIAEINPGLKIDSPFTRDREALLKVIDDLRPVVGSNPLDVFNIEGRPGDNYLDELQQQVSRLEGGLSSLCYSLSALPGRKYIVFFSEGYPMDPVAEVEFESRQSSAFRSIAVRQKMARQAGRSKDPGVGRMIKEVVSLANHFGISFYTVDVHGLIGVPSIQAQLSGQPPDPGTAFADAEGYAVTAGGELRQLAGAHLTTFKLTKLSEIQDAQNTLIALAAGTNGSAFYNSNNLEAVLHASTLEQRNLYLAVFEPKVKHKKGRFHRIQLRSRRRGVLIRSQAGFLDVPQQKLANLRRGLALRHPELFQHLKPIVEVDPAPGKTRVVVGLPGAQISARRRGAGYRIDLVFMGQVYGAGNEPIFKKLPILRGFQMDLSAERFREVAARPVMGQNQLSLPPGDYRIVLAVEDLVSGALGASSREFLVK
ncbi:MAG: VWA domain-containing protein [Acidobacteriota bacterium]